MEEMIRAGMDVARLNFSHGDFASHEKTIQDLRAASQATGRRLAIMADLPGPKIRIGQFAEEPIELRIGEFFTLTTDNIIGDSSRVSTGFSRLPQVVKTGDRLYLNDGLIQIEVVKVEGTDIRCRVLVGGELRSKKGLNLPGIDLGIRVFTEWDHRWLQFAKEQNLDAVSQSFVEGPADIAAVRAAAADLNYHPFIVAKIERLRALNNIDEILDVTDGIMIARGDLGVEIPIEQIAVLQKDLMEKANLKGRPVITATQMLESMTGNRRPTRAESTDVANAILDGTDCVMLSGESAMGKYPVDAVAMLAKIAAATEPHRIVHHAGERLKAGKGDGEMNLVNLITRSVANTVAWVSSAVVLVPTRSGATARSLTRFRLPVWIVAVSSQPSICQGLQFSYGVYSVHEAEHPADWRQWLQTHGIEGDFVILTEGPSTKHPETNNRMEIIDLRPVSKCRGKGETG